MNAQGTTTTTLVATATNKGGNTMKTFSVIVVTLAIVLAALMPFLRTAPADAQSDEGGMAEWLETVAGGVVGHLTGPAGEIGFHFLLHPCETYWGAIASAVRAEEIRALTIMASDPDGRTQEGRDAAARQELLRVLSEQWMAACGGSETARAAIRDAIIKFKRATGLIAPEPTPTPTPAPVPGGDSGGGTSGGASGGTTGGSTADPGNPQPPETPGGSANDPGGSGAGEDPCDPCKELRDKLAAAEAALAANLAQQAALQAQIAALQAQIAAMQAQLQEMQDSILTGYRNRSDPNHGLLTDNPGGVDPAQWEQIWVSQSDLDAIAALQAQIAAAQVQLAALQGQLAALQAAEQALRDQIDDLKKQLEECEKKHAEGKLEDDPCPPQHNGSFFGPLSDPFASGWSLVESGAVGIGSMAGDFFEFVGGLFGLGGSDDNGGCSRDPCDGAASPDDLCASDECDGSADAPCDDHRCADCPDDGCGGVPARADCTGACTEEGATPGQPEQTPAPSATPFADTTPTSPETDPMLDPQIDGPQAAPPTQPPAAPVPTPDPAPTPPPAQVDSDTDGVPDQFDLCPQEFGYPELGGCPSPVHQPCPELACQPAR